MIAVIDYGMGNLRSVAKGLEKTGQNVSVTSSKQRIVDARGVVLPGVGAFRDCMINLDRLGLIETVKSQIGMGKPFLGICLGLQVLFETSEEYGPTEGLGVFKGKVVRFPEDMKDPDAKEDDAPFLKVPHMGWNQVSKKQDIPILDGIAGGDYFYFVHSYYVAPEYDSIAATKTDYGIEFVSSIAHENLFASQFHPEKSQALGLKILENFGRQVNG